MKTIMIKLRMTGVSIVVASFGFMACSSVSNHERLGQSESPEDVVRKVCVQRISDYATFQTGKWKLEEMKRWLSSGLNEKITIYVREYEQFLATYSRYNIPEIGPYLMLAQVDPITGCPGPIPELRPIVQLISQDRSRCDYQLTYNVSGNDRLLHSQSVTIHLTRSKAGWVINDADYGMPIPVIGGKRGQVRTCGEMLEEMTEMLKKASIWAANHHGEFLPKNDQ